MWKRKLCFTQILALILLCVFSMGLIVVAGNDNVSNTDRNDWGGYFDDATKGQWSVYGDASTGTTYSIVLDGETVSFDLPAGTTIPGSDGIKGYNSTGNSSFGLSIPEFQLQNNGTLVLNPSDFAALAKSQGREDIADKINSGANFTAFTEQYLNVIKPGGATEKMLVTDLMEQLQAHDASGGGYWEGIGFLRNVIESSFVSFTELEQDDPLRMYMELLGLDQKYMQGFGIYVFEGGIVLNPPPEPGKPQPPLYTLRYTGTPDCSKSPSTELKIENRDFQVAAGNTIPTSEELRIMGSTDLYGKVNNIQNWELVINGNRVYTANAKWHWGYERSYTYEYEDEVAVYERIDGKRVKVGTKTVTKTARGTESWPKEESAPSKDPDYDYGSTREVYHSVSASSSPTIPSPGRQSYKVTYSANVVEINGVTVTNETLGGKIIVPVDGPGLSLSGKSTVRGDSASRVSYSFSCNLGSYSTYEAAKAAVDREAASPTMSKYWSVRGDGPVTVSGGGGSKSYENNCPVLAGEMGGSRITINELGVKEINPNRIINKCEEGRNYPTTHAAHLIGGMEMYPITGVNPVRVHTPIYNELKVEPTNKNQLENLNLAKDASGNQVPIVTLGEKVKITVNIVGHPTQKDSYYYDDNIAIRLTDLSKYVKEVRIECGLCGKTLSSLRGELTKEGNNYVHTCNVAIERQDNVVHPIKSIVIAENIPSGVPENNVAQDARYNIPDNYYVLTQNGGVYIAGKIYDLEVRATNDPGWKDLVGKQVQKLNKMPVGEKGDNALAAYKPGIKLGYRAFFDLKTLGVATKTVKITPRIYYITPEGKVDNTVDIYYRTNNNATYKQLTDSGTLLPGNDIMIKMSMNTTKGETYNPVFKEEQLKTLKELNTAINYAKVDSIGGFKEIMLDAGEALMTKYNGAYVSSPDKSNSRRWYGEVYIPSTTRVVKDGTKVEDVARGVNVIKTGYLLITFDPIETTTATGAQYLRYSTAHTPTGTDDTNGYIMMTEKAGKGNTVAITLPNGKAIPKAELDKMVVQLPNVGNNKTENFYSDVAPIIIYDVSVRGNDDLASDGTH